MAHGQVDRKICALDYQTADEAIACAIGKGWLIGEGKPPHRICFTNECRGYFQARTLAIAREIRSASSSGRISGAPSITSAPASLMAAVTLIGTAFFGAGFVAMPGCCFATPEERTCPIDVAMVDL
jgi:hypothetical protein